MTVPEPTTARPSVHGHRHGRVPREVRHTQLLDLAEQLFVTNGYDGFSIEDLRRAAGVSRPIVYEHFGSKDAIFIAVMGRIWDAFQRDLSEYASTPADLIAAGGDAYFSAVAKNPAVWSLVYSASAITGAVADAFHRLKASNIASIVELGRLLLPEAHDEHLTAMAHAIFGADEELGRWWLRNPGIPQARIVAYHCEFVKAVVAGAAPE